MTRAGLLALAALAMAAGGAGARAETSHAEAAMTPGGDEIAGILALEPDLGYGAYLASDCTSCHADAAAEGIPRIRDLPTGTIVAALVDYRRGARQHQVMETIARRLGDEEIAALAAFLGEAD
ncbi:c-type cytochrome [Roseivivax marinus]|uniref:c-type cytochrome n=1 Tax=Roseivivax marinus TaxID=1379903 RepID=UPI000B894EA9|nr:c-type cytochrome [Roseivivax marinus]